VAIRDPKILLPGTLDPKWPQSTEWFERRIAEFTLQTKLVCFRNELGEWCVEASVWDAWETEIVEYFIHNTYGGPEIEAFVQMHVLGNGR
jgi:hypothetical protein